MKRFLFVFSMVAVVALAACKKEDMISFDEDEFIFEYTGGTDQVTIITNVRWKVSATADWITLTPEEGRITVVLKVSVTENTSDSERYGEVIVTQVGGEQISDTLKVIQRAR